MVKRKWEYKMIELHGLEDLGVCYSSMVEGNKNQITKQLKKLGEQGWEMCGIASESSNSEWQVFFKREL